MGELERRFRPEFLNRLDEVVIFKALTLSEIERIVELLLNDLRQRLVERRLSLTVTPAARHLIAQQGFDPVYGARPLRRFIAHQVETKVARALLGTNPIEGGEVRLDYGDDGLLVSIEAPEVEGRGGVSLSESTVVRCATCGTKNRIRWSASGIPRCGKCKSLLPWIAESGDETFADLVTGQPSLCWSISGLRGAVRAER